jgi:hypothetical protein
MSEEKYDWISRFELNTKGEGHISCVCFGGREERRGGKGDFYGELKWWGPQCSPYYLVMQRGSPRDSLRHRKECPPPKCHRHHPSPRSPLVIAPAPSPVPSSSLARGPHSRSPLTPVRHCPCCWWPLSSPPYRSPLSDPSCLPLLIDGGLTIAVHVGPPSRSFLLLVGHRPCRC